VQGTCTHQVLAQAKSHSWHVGRERYWVGQTQLVQPHRRFIVGLSLQIIQRFISKGNCMVDVGPKRECSSSPDLTCLGVRERRDGDGGECDALALCCVGTAWGMGGPRTGTGAGIGGPPGTLKGGGSNGPGGGGYGG